MINIELNRLLEKSIHLAVNAHLGQVDKAGMPYIFHPMRVMQNCVGLEEKIVAILHDILEDTNTTIQQLEESGLPANIIEAIVTITKIDSESYHEFIKRVSNNKLATSVKKQDLLDNMDLTRLECIDDVAQVRYTKYEEAFTFLSAVESR